MKVFGINLFKSSIKTNPNPNAGSVNEFRKVVKKMIELDDWFQKNVATEVNEIKDRYKKPLLTTEEKHKLSRKLWDEYKINHKI